jgi:hypothetical protein
LTVLDLVFLILLLVVVEEVGEVEEFLVVGRSRY